MKHLLIAAALALGSGYSATAEAATCKTSCKSHNHKSPTTKKANNKTTNVKVKAGVSVKVTRKPYDRHPEKPRCTKVWVPGHWEGFGRKRHYVKGHWEVRR